MHDGDSNGRRGGRNGNATTTLATDGATVKTAVAITDLSRRIGGCGDSGDGDSVNVGRGDINGTASNCWQE